MKRLLYAVVGLLFAGTVISMFIFGIVLQKLAFKLKGKATLYLWMYDSKRLSGNMESRLYIIERHGEYEGSLRENVP